MKIPVFNDLIHWNVSDRWQKYSIKIEHFSNTKPNLNRNLLISIIEMIIKMYIVDQDINWNMNLIFNDLIHWNVSYRWQKNKNTIIYKLNTVERFMCTFLKYGYILLNLIKRHSIFSNFHVGVIKTCSRYELREISWFRLPKK